MLKKTLLLILVWLSAPVFGQEPMDDFYNKTDAFLSKYAANNLVNYKAIKNNPSELNGLVKTINEFYPEGGDAGLKAFYINAYNLLAIKQIVDNYPIQSPNEVPGFYDANEFQIGSLNITLNHLENNILRKDFKDPRLHFVLVCGALGCPPIASFAYRSEILDEQLNTQTKKALNSNFIFEKDGKIQLSQIFNWYKADFGSNAELLEFINSYREVPFAGKSIQFYPYDWTLNEPRSIAPIEGKKMLPENNDVNLQTFTPGTLLAKGRWDITIFNSLYTQTESNWLGIDYVGPRESFYSTLVQVTLGTTKNKRVNLGFDASFRSSAKRTDLSFSSAFDVFSFKNNDSTRVGVSSLGPRIKWIPFAGNSDFSLQSTFTFSTSQNNEGRGGDNPLSWLDWNRFTSWTQFFYAKTRGDFQLFLEADILARIRTSKDQITHVDVPITAIGSWFFLPKWTVYGIVQHSTRYTYNIFDVPQEVDFVQPSNYTAPGIGLKFQPVSNLTLELLYSNFVRGVNNGFGETFNFGIKYLPKPSKKAKFK